MNEKDIVELCKHNVSAILHREIEKQYVTGNMDMFLIAHHSTILAEMILEDIAKAIMDKLKKEEHKRKFISKDEIEFQNKVEEYYKD